MVSFSSNARTKHDHASCYETGDTVAKTLVVTVCLLVGITTPERGLLSQSVDRSAIHTNRLSALAPLEGVWVAKGEGFSTRLAYEWALPGVLLRARNEVRNDAGAIVAQYEGHYMWDPAQSAIVFWTVAQTGELHRGTVTQRNDAVWHDATVSGGTISGYRSVMAVVGDEIHYRAKYEPSSSDEAVLASAPLIYRRAAR
jgi:hypothetical protein